MSLKSYSLCDNTVKGTNMKKIPLTQGKYALVDDEDFAELSQYKWQYSCGYATRGVSRRDQRLGMPSKVNMQRQLLGYPKGMDTDHINGDKLDNRRFNLRACSHTENTRNRAKEIRNTSGYVGVHWHKVNKKWVAQIKVNQKVVYLGSFTSVKEAINTRREAAMKYFGEYARKDT
jgi:hypothetical protein